mmetsp:Transcript_18375/g.35429  ORF Transcript_18375/g.35429 Transcript_18375/m.35429 type:complete len:480 (-) Transcript_18375:429-1868(-)
MPGTVTRLAVVAAALMIWHTGAEELCLGELSMEGGGSPGYILGGPPGHVKGGALTLPHNSGYSIMTGCKQKWDPKEFFMFKVLDRTLSYTVDLSKVGCGCNLALYMVQAPGLDIAGNPSVGDCEDDSPYYCDANKVCGQWCPEMDIMEANIKAFQATPHSCDAPTPTGHYSNCDRSGCGLSTRDIPNSYGPGDTFQIDTTKPFDVETTWQANNMITKLVQGASIVTLDHSNCGASLGGMAAAMTSGMSVRITYWGSDANTMAWLDSPPCGSEVCSGDNAGNATISNLRITPPLPPQKTTMPTSTETTTTTVTTTTTTTLPATMFSNNPVVFDFLSSFIFGALFTGALGAAISFLIPRILKHRGSSRGTQASTPREPREPHVQRAVALAVVCLMVVLIFAWHPLFQSSSSPVRENLIQDTTHEPVTSMSPMATTPLPQVAAPTGCCSWDGGKTCGESTKYCMSAKTHCEKHCAGKWKVGN